MSSILKALQRLEQEKVAHQPGTLQVDREILSSERTRTKVPLLLAGGLALFVCGSGLTYYVVTQSVSQRSPAPRPPEVAQPVTPAPASSTPTPSVPVERSVAKPAAPVIKEPVKKAAAAPATVKPAAVTVKPVVRAAAPKAEPSLKKRQEAPSAAAQLQVSGIAFRDGMDDNLAMVNGTPLPVGALIEGARIEQIMKDKVLFSRNGSQFTVHLGSSGP